MKSIKVKLLNFPTIYKVLIANSLIIMIGATAGTWLTQELFHRSALGLISIFVLIGITVSILVNFFILKAAFQPLNSLHETVEAVYRGDLMARVTSGPIGDPLINRLRDALNSMLAELSTSHQRLENLYHQIQEQEKERGELLGKIITAQEEERRRIARELHDDISQALTSLMLGLRFTDDLIEVPQAKEKLAELRALAGGTLDRVRQLAIELRPSLLDDLGLVSAIQRYAMVYSSKTGLNIDCVLDDLGKPYLAPEVEISIYRIMQEALTNIVKHAKATKVSIITKLRNSTLTIVIEDDGQGFEVEKVMSQAYEKRLGLLGMRERATLIGGRLTIESQPGDGTSLFLELPVKSLQELQYEQNKSASG